MSENERAVAGVNLALKMTFDALAKPPVEPPINAGEPMTCYDNERECEYRNGPSEEELYSREHAR